MRNRYQVHIVTAYVKVLCWCCGCGNEVRTKDKMSEIADVDITNTDLFVQVLQNNGQPFRSEQGHLCFQRKADGMLFFIEDTAVPTELSVEPEQFGTDLNGALLDKRCKWRREGILALIDLRKKYETQFQSTTLKNETVWKKLANEMAMKGFHMTATQCNDKWRYLKAKYQAKKDNMGPRGTGEEPVDFEYFDTMDAFLGRKHNVTPTAIASSSRGDTVFNQQENDNDNVLEERPQKKKKRDSDIATKVKENVTPMQAIVKGIQTAAEQREANRAQRHRETLEARQRAIDVFSSKMDLLIQQLQPHPGH